jgi:hypothetical protein
MYTKLIIIVLEKNSQVFWYKYRFLVEIFVYLA